MILLMFLVKEPQRGGVDGAETLQSQSWFKEVREICRVFVEFHSLLKYSSFVVVFQQKFYFDNLGIYMGGICLRRTLLVGTKVPPIR